MVSNSPDDVSVTVSVSGNPVIDGQTFRPTTVNGFDRAVYMLMDNTLKTGGAVSDTALVNAGNVSIADYSNIKLWQVTYKKLHNFVDIYTSLNRTYYTVVPVGDKGELHKPGAQGSVVKNTQEVDEIDWVYAEMVRRNQYLFETTGEPAYIMFRKWRGEPCGCTFGSHSKASMAAQVVLRDRVHRRLHRSVRLLVRPARLRYRARVERGRHQDHAHVAQLSDAHAYRPER